MVETKPETAVVTPGTGSARAILSHTESLSMAGQKMGIQKQKEPADREGEEYEMSIGGDPSPVKLTKPEE